MLAFLIEHASWLLPIAAPALGILSNGLPKAWKLAMIGAAVVVAAVAVLWIRWDLADKTATIAQQQVDLVTLGQQRDQEKATAAANLAVVANLQKQLRDEAARRERERQALRAAIDSRDKIIDEARRAKDAQAPMPDAWLPTFRRVR